MPPGLPVVLVLFGTGVVSGAQTIVTLEVSGTVGDVSGSYVGGLVPGQEVTAIFVYDTDEALAGPGSQTTPSTEPGHEFSSFYEFASPPYGATVTIPALPATFTSNTAGLVVNDDMFMAGADVNNYVSDGTYDWIEILGSTTVDGPTGNPADGEEWTFAMFANPGWILDGSLIPDDLPPSYTPVMLGAEFDEFENETGLVWVNVNSVTVIPEPATTTLMGGALLVLLARRSAPARRPEFGSSCL